MPFLYKFDDPQPDEYSLGPKGGENEKKVFLVLLVLADFLHFLQNVTVLPKFQKFIAKARMNGFFKISTIVLEGIGKHL